MTGKSDQPKDKGSQEGGRMMKLKRSSIPHDEDANARPGLNSEGGCNMMVSKNKLNWYGYNYESISMLSLLLKES
jgi:hypothetical protein